MSRLPTSIKASLFVVFVVASVFILLLTLGDVSRAGFGQWKKAFEILTGFWLLATMLTSVALAVKIPRVIERIGGMTAYVPLHRWLGYMTLFFLALHCLAASGPKWAVQLGLMSRMAKKKAASNVPPDWFEITYRFLGHHGDILGYAILILFLLVFCLRFLDFLRWIRIHRLFAVVAFLGACHGVCGFPNNMRLGLLQCVVVMMLIASVALLWLLYRPGRFRV